MDDVGIFLSMASSTAVETIGRSMSPKNWVIADSSSISFRIGVLSGESIAKLLISKMLQKAEKAEI